jgi:hypothetical protein
VEIEDDLQALGGGLGHRPWSLDILKGPIRGKRLRFPQAAAAPTIVS